MHSSCLCPEYRVQGIAIPDGSQQDLLDAFLRNLCSHYFSKPVFDARSPNYHRNHFGFLTAGCQAKGEKFSTYYFCDLWALHYFSL